MPDLYSELEKLAGSDIYPFHMPGHKRNVESTPLKGAFRCDITEIDGFDNLHDENGIILKAEERANNLYGADKTYFLVNGSTCGVCSAVSAAVPVGGKILAARGSHKSFYHAAYLRQLNIEYLPVRMIKKYGIYDGYLAEDIENAIANSEKGTVSAVFITSPTYEGVCSDIEGISKVCHEAGIVLIVDAAHGAHFGFDKRLPRSAVQCGADIVIHSVHKTLPSMTQTALLHVKGDRVDRELLKRFLRIYQSSSPSYVLLSSIDLCMKEMEEHGGEFADNLLKYRKMLENSLSGCRNIAIAGLDELKDPAKALIYLQTEDMTGQQLYDILREEYHLQMEMAGERYALAILSGWDKKEGIDRLISALLDIDRRISQCRENTADRSGEKETKADAPDIEDKLPHRAMKISDAWDKEKESVPLCRAEGRISGEFIALYPPGIPLIVPGEIFDRKRIDEFNKYLDYGMNLQGVLTKERVGKKGIIDGREVICVRQR